MSGRYRVAMASTTPGNLSEGVLVGLDAVVERPADIDFLVHGTTQGLNAFLERRGVPVLLLGTAGVEDSYHIARGPRTRLCDTRGDTCHLDVADKFGMMISATPSGGWFQASPTIPGLAFCLSTRGQMFWVEDGLPNSLRPGARPRTTLSPSFALRDGKPWLAFGTPGGDFQDQ